MELRKNLKKKERIFSYIDQSARFKHPRNFIEIVVGPRTGESSLANPESFYPGAFQNVIRTLVSPVARKRVLASSLCICGI